MTPPVKVKSGFYGTDEAIYAVGKSGKVWCVLCVSLTIDPEDPIPMSELPFEAQAMVEDVCKTVFVASKCWE